jgi:hypothetical protein
VRPHVPSIDPLLFDRGGHSDPGDSESEGSDVDRVHDLDVDERSEDEDDRAAHELLRAAPTAVLDPIDPRTILPYNHRGFAVS